VREGWSVFFQIAAWQSCWISFCAFLEFSMLDTIGEVAVYLKLFLFCASLGIVLHIMPRVCPVHTVAFRRILTLISRKALFVIRIISELLYFVKLVRYLCWLLSRSPLYSAFLPSLVSSRLCNEKHVSSTLNPTAPNPAWVFFLVSLLL